MNFGPLRVFNNDIIQPGTGFDLHQHHDMEIVTYVIEGSLNTKTTRGTTALYILGRFRECLQVPE